MPGELFDRTAVALARSGSESGRQSGARRVAPADAVRQDAVSRATTPADGGWVTSSAYADISREPRNAFQRLGEAGPDSARRICQPPIVPAGRNARRDQRPLPDLPVARRPPVFDRRRADGVVRDDLGAVGARGARPRIRHRVGRDDRRMAAAGRDVRDRSRRRRRASGWRGSRPIQRSRSRYEIRLGGLSATARVVSRRTSDSTWCSAARRTFRSAPASKATIRRRSPAASSCAATLRDYARVAAEHLATGRPVRVCVSGGAERASASKPPRTQQHSLIVRRRPSGVHGKARPPLIGLVRDDAGSGSARREMRERTWVEPPLVIRCRGWPRSSGIRGASSWRRLSPRLKRVPGVRSRS